MYVEVVTEQHVDSDEEEDQETAKFHDYATHIYQRIGLPVSYENHEQLIDTDYVTLKDQKRGMHVLEDAKNCWRTKLSREETIQLMFKKEEIENQDEPLLVNQEPFVCIAWVEDVFFDKTQTQIETLDLSAAYYISHQDAKIRGAFS